MLKIVVKIFNALLVLIVWDFITKSAAPSKDCTPKPTDLVFVLDESGSVGEENFKLQNEFVAKFVEGFDIGKTKTQVAVLKFSSIVEVEFYLNSYYDKTRMLQAIREINYTHPGLTWTHLALMNVRTELLDKTNGRRSNALPFVMVLTDGRSMIPAVTISQANQLHALNVTVFAIGISKEVYEEELRGIASSPQNVIVINDFKSLMSIQKQALNGACDALLKKVHGDNYTITTPTTTTTFTTTTNPIPTTTPTTTTSPTTTTTSTTKTTPTTTTTTPTTTTITTPTTTTPTTTTTTTPTTTTTTTTTTTPITMTRTTTKSPTTITPTTTTTPNGISNTIPTAKTSTKTNKINTKLQRHRSPFLIPGWFQIIEIGLIVIITLVGIGLVGCCCFKFCGGKKEEDEDENDDIDADTSAWKANHQSPEAKPGGWINGF